VSQIQPVGLAGIESRPDRPHDRRRVVGSAEGGVVLTNGGDQQAARTQHAPGLGHRRRRVLGTKKVQQPNHRHHVDRSVPKRYAGDVSERDPARQPPSRHGRHPR